MCFDQGNVRHGTAPNDAKSKFPMLARWDVQMQKAERQAFKCTNSKKPSRHIQLLSLQVLKVERFSVMSPLVLELDRIVGNITGNPKERSEGGPGGLFHA